MHVKHLRRNLTILLTIAIAMLAVGIAMGIRGKSGDTPRIDFFDIDAKNFIAETHRIKRMEIWVVPENAMSEKEWKTLGLMKRESHWFSWAAWTLPIPSEAPTNMLQIMVRGYDKEGTEMDRVSLPWIGEETLKEEIWKIEN